MSKNMNVNDIRDEIVLLKAVVDSIIDTYSKPKSTILTPNEEKPQLELHSSDYIKGLANNIITRMHHLNETIVKMN